MGRAPGPHRGGSPAHTGKATNNILKAKLSGSEGATSREPAAILEDKAACWPISASRRVTPILTRSDAGLRSLPVSPQPLRLQVTRFLLLMSHLPFYAFLSLQKAYFSSPEATSCVGDTCLTSGDNFLGT